MQPTGKYCSIRHTEYSEFQTGIFWWNEKRPSFHPVAVERSRLIAKQADVIAAMSLEVLKGTTRAFDACRYKQY